MPQLSDILEKRAEKKFVKKNYRPWDLTGSNPESQDITNAAPEKTKANSQAEQKPNPSKKSDKKIASSLIKKTSTPQPSSEQGEYNSDSVDDNVQKVSGNKEVTYREQTGNKEVTYREQTGNTSGNIQVTYRQQTGNDLGNNLGNDLGNNLGNNLGNKDELDVLIEEVKKLSGLQEKIFFFMVELCLSRGLLDTGKIYTHDLASVANCSIGSAKTSIIRLLEKGVMQRRPGKSSRGGHIAIQFSQAIFQAALHVQQEKARQHIFQSTNSIKNNHLGNDLGNNLGNNLGNDLGNNPPPISSSSIKTTTTALPENWENIDHSPLNHIGFHKTQIYQLYERELNTPEIIQESIHHFAFALENNPKAKAYDDPLNVIMGVLRKGGMWHEKNYVSPKEKALADLVEFKKQEAERLAILEKQLINEEFRLWQNNLDPIKKETILQAAPKSQYLSKTMMEKTYDAFLLEYFKNNIYQKQ
jgi:hypothetical protein